MICKCRHLCEDHIGETSACEIWDCDCRHFEDEFKEDDR